MKRTPCIVLAKPGLDGHDKGIRLVAMALRDAGFDVHYLGLRQSIEGIVSAAKEKKADFIGLSILSGTHLDVARKMLAQIEEEQLACRLFIGGVIPKADAEQLRKMGVAQVFPVGTTFAAMNAWIVSSFED